ncbi:MAG: copper-binding protein [Proteobacteria bacterium]|nr:copper-binding protein [Pseudomonadota bacterium]
MMLAKAILAGSVLTAISSVALAQGTPPIKETPPPPGVETGLVTVVNRLDGTVVIEPTKDSKAGAKGAATNDAAAKAAAEKAAAEKAAAEDAMAQRFKIKSSLIEGVHAGDKVKFSVTDTDGTKTITKIDAD